VNVSVSQIRFSVLKISVNLSTALLTAIALLFPGKLFLFFQNIDRLVWFKFGYFKYLTIIGFIFACCRNKRIVIFTILSIGLLELTQYGNLAYFGDFINPYTIGQIFNETGDISKVVISSAQHLYYVVLVIIFPYSALLLIINTIWKYQYKIRFAEFFIIIVLLWPAAKFNYQIRTNIRKDIVSYFPSFASPPIANTLNSYSMWLTYLVPQSFFSPEERTFKPINIVKKAVDKQMNIVLVMGESFTYRRMSLFGAERETTPMLDALRSDENFVYKKGYSTAITTLASLPLFFNIQYNPLDHNSFRTQTTNIFKLAKEAGFQTIFISAQASSCLNGLNTGQVDHFISLDSERKLFAEKKDDALLELLSTIKMQDRNFIVLHQRNAHSPYESNYEKHPELARFPSDGANNAEYMKNTYDNAMLYNDYLYNNIIEYCKKNIQSPAYLFITSDHGEEFGEQGIWGHAHLTYGSALVPIMFYNIQGDPLFLEKFKALEMPTHYELGLLIADRLGYSINDPNREKDWYYIDGVAVSGLRGYMKFRKSEGEVPKELLVF